MIDFAKKLNAEQLAVVERGDGPCLVLAGAGSGKTRTIVHRVAFLLEKGIKAENILLVTFTNKAAAEMKRRVAELMGAPEGTNVLPWSGTFHHIAYRWLRAYAPLLGYKPGFTILDSDDSETLLKNSIKKYKPDGEKRFPSPGVISAVIGYARNSQLPLSAVIERRFEGLYIYEEIIKDIAADYARRKKEANAMDFDDLLANCLVLLSDVKLQEKYASQFQYILVDEYQDTNKIQAEIIKKLAAVHKNVLVVGDDAQSIYSFRAAAIENILQFERDYPGAQMFKLETNYRSGREILDLANGVIENNRGQFQKQLKTVTELGYKPALHPHLDQPSEAQFVVEKITQLQEQGIKPKEIAVLFRAAHHSQQLEMELLRAGIPYDYRGGLRFFERAHIKDVLAYLRVINNLADTAAWTRILLKEDGIGPMAANKIIEEIKRLNIDRDSSVALGMTFIRDIGQRVLGAKAQVGWNNFLEIWNGLSVAGKAPDKLIKVLLDSRYTEYLKLEFTDSRDRIADIEQMAVFAKQHDDLEEFLAEATLQESFSLKSANSKIENSEKVVLSTIHQAKGLEWHSVFIINLASGAFPNDRAVRERGGMEEERRLLYVAVTRAKKNLFLTYPMAGGGWGDSVPGPSVFLSELSAELLDDHSLLSVNSSVFNDSSEDIQYISEDQPIKIRPGSFLRDIGDL